MADALVLSEGDARLLQGLLSWWRQQPASVPAREPPPRPGPAPDVYVAQTPAGGIPALAGVPGTGTLVNEQPGSADCAIYRLQGGLLAAVPGLTRTVYNTTRAVISGSLWLPVWRDKFGSWLVGSPPADASFFAQVGARTEVGAGFLPYTGTGPAATYLYDFIQVAPAYGWAWAAVSGGLDLKAAAREFNNNDSVSPGKVVRMYPGFNGAGSYTGTGTGPGSVMEYVFFYPKALTDVSASGSCVAGAPAVALTKTWD